MVLALCVKKHPATVYAALMAELSKDTASNILSVLLQYAEEEKGVWNEELAALVARDLGRFVGLTDHCTCNMEDSIEALLRSLRGEGASE